MIVVHFIDVGQGNMTLVEIPDGVFLVDCNVNDENEERVLAYLKAELKGRPIGFFINSHRDADHMRGLKRITAKFPIAQICDNGVPCGTPDCTEYKEYMACRLAAPKAARLVKRGEVWNYTRARVRVLSGENSRTNDGNAQSIVLKIENLTAAGAVLNSVMLTGDSDVGAWENWIVPVYGNELPASVLLASHHGSDSFFARADGYRYTKHIAAINPTLTVISVGENPHGHPDPAAVRAYGAWSMGADDGKKILRTDEHGTMRLLLGDDDDGRWKNSWKGPSPEPPKPAPARTLPGRTLATRGTLLTGVRPPAPGLRIGGRTISTSSDVPTPLRSLADILRIPATPPPKQLVSLADILKIAPSPSSASTELRSIADALKIPTAAPTSPELLSLADSLPLEPQPPARSGLQIPPPPKTPLELFLEAMSASKPKTPAEEFIEWLARQRR